MSFLVWNYHGLGNLRIGKELEVVVRAKDPSVMFIVEIWANEIRLKEVQWNLDFENLFFVERNNRGGGLDIGEIQLIYLLILSQKTTLML